MRLLDSAHDAHSQPADEQDPYAVAAGVAISLVDCYRRMLAELVPGERRDGHGDRGRPALPDPAFSGSSVPDTITERFDGIWAADAPVPAGRAVGHGAARG